MEQGGGAFLLLMENADLSQGAHSRSVVLTWFTKEKARDRPHGVHSFLPPVFAAYPRGCRRMSSTFIERDARCVFPVFQGFSLSKSHYIWLPGCPSFAFQKVG